MYNRYVGNTGKYYRVKDNDDEAEDEKIRTSERTAAPFVTETVGSGREPSGLGNLFSGFNLPVNLPFGLKSSDLTLMLIFLFLYLQSGDDEFLILLAAVVVAGMI